MTRTPPPHVLIFEPDPHGHTQEWLAHISRFAARERPDWRITFAVAPELAAAIPPGKNIGIMPLDARTTVYCLHASLPVSGFARWWAMRRLMKRSRADHGLILCLDHLSLPLALGLRIGKPVTGILFRPSTHYAELHPEERPTAKERIRDFRKRVFYALMLRNRSLRKVLSLDPYFPDHARRLFAQGRKVEAICDPAFPLPAASEPTDIIPAGRTVFLLFGALAARKGVLTLLAALHKVDVHAASNIAVVIAGRVEPGIAAMVEDGVAELRHAQPALWLRLENRRLPVSELSALVHRCDVILAPYQRFVGSSGVLLWAASVGKPVITQNYGLLGKLCRENELGLSIDTTDPAMLAKAIEDMTLNGVANFDKRSAARFVASQTPRHFAATLFDAVPSIFPPSPAGDAAAVFQSHTGHASPYR